MSTELAKTFEPKSTQDEALRLWGEANAFHAEPGDSGRPYSIVIPPPNVTAALHLGHALNNTLQDILIRWHRMQGDNTMWMPGTDHAGIATQSVVEKRVLQEEGKRRTEFKRDEFVAKIQAWKDEYEARITEQLKAMGCSCDWQRQAFTMDEPRAKAVREAFFRLFKDGLIYRGKRLVNWDPATQTALADDEVEMEEIDGHFYYLKYPLVEDPAAEAALPSLSYVTVATTRPETMLGDTAVAINPKDPRAAALRGKFVRLPIVGRVIPIVEDDYVVLPDPASDDAKAKFATGFLKVTPAHDPNDYEIGRRHNLAVINVMAPDGSISDKHGWSDIGEAGFVVGMDRYEARKAIVAWFRENHLLEEVKPYRHSVGHSYRSHVPIEPYLSDQWYVKVTDERLAGAALRAMAKEGEERDEATERRSDEGNADASSSPSSLRRSVASSLSWEGQLRFYPARYAKTFQTWHENIRDWCISRQLWWGHRIPVWSYQLSDESLRFIRTGVGRLPDKSGHAIETLGLLVAEYPADISIAPSPTAIPFRTTSAFKNETIDVPSSGLLHVCVRGRIEAEESLKAAGFIQDPDVLDTWFSSGLWPLSTLNWPDPSPALQTWNPTSVLCTAREIITLWVSRMVMFNLYLENRLPFTDVFIHAMIQDGHGQKMSKSLGNGVDPIDIIHSHGADALRFTMTSMATNTQDVRMPLALIDPYTGETIAPKFVNEGGYTVAAPIQESPANPKKKMVSSYGITSGRAKATPEMPLAMNTSPKFDVGRNFCNKLWNAARFVLSSIEGSGSRVQGSEENQSAIRNPQSAIPPAPEPQTLNPEPSPVDESKWSLADRWIVSRFNRTVEAVNDALANYRFDQYAKPCYDFFWGDFCDWYVEAIKPALRDPARKTQTAHVLAAVLDGTLRLMHPMIPFITEILYQRLNEVRPIRGLPGRLECESSEPKTGAGTVSSPQSAIRNSQSAIPPLLIRAPWPKVGDFSQASEHIFPKLQEIITAIRNLRNGYNVPPKQTVTVSISAPAEPTRQITDNREMIESLATCTIKEVKPDLRPAASAVRAAAAGVDIFVEGLVDEAAEKARVAKACDDLAKTIKTLRGRLASEAYTSKAPAHLVQQTRDQLATAQAERAKLGCPDDTTAA